MRRLLLVAELLLVTSVCFVSRFIVLVCACDGVPVGHFGWGNHSPQPVLCEVRFDPQSAGSELARATCCVFTRAISTVFFFTLLSDTTIYIVFMRENMACLSVVPWTYLFLLSVDTIAALQPYFTSKRCSIKKIENVINGLDNVLLLE
jgi:hypothetical protein